ncbi:MAG: hypothetical protein OXU25_05590 [Thaumarchaeota archaeon]|nr:hypothetical protein [Nitrososphaerota archaeon]
MRAAVAMALAAALLAALLAPAHAQEGINPSLGIRDVAVPAGDFNVVARDAEAVALDEVHATSWQVTIRNGLEYVEGAAGAVLRLHDAGEEGKFIEVGMGPPPDRTFWAAVRLPSAEGYVPVHSMAERGWSPSAAVIVAYTDRAGMTINNGQRIVVSNLDVGEFAISSWSVHGVESYLDGPSVASGEYRFEILSGDPAENAFHLFPFYVTAAVGALAGLLFLTKRR